MGYRRSVFKRWVSCLTMMTFIVFNVMPSANLFAITCSDLGSPEAGGFNCSDSGNGVSVTTLREVNLDLGNFDSAAGSLNVFDLSLGDFTANVIGNNPTLIGGNFEIMNGVMRIFNANGVHVLSTADFKFENGSLLAAAGNMNKITGKINATGFVLNEGNFHGTGDLALVGKAVENRGTIDLPANHVFLAGGKVLTVGLSGDNLVSVVVDEAVGAGEGEGILDFEGKPIKNQIENSRKKDKDGNWVDAKITGHQVTLDAKGVDSVFEKAINLKGEIQAKGVNITKEGIVQFVAGEIDMSAQDDIHNEGLLEASRMEIHSDGDIATRGTLRAGTLNESGASFKISGVYEVGESFHDNLDHAIIYDADTTLSGTITDVENIIINSGVVLTLSDITTFTADSDQNATGSFTMNIGSSILGNGYDLTINSSNTMTLRDVLDAGSFNASAELTENDNIRLLGNIRANFINISAYENIEVDGELAATDVSLLANTNQSGGGALIAGSNANLDASRSIALQSGASIRLSDWLDENEQFKTLSVTTVVGDNLEGKIILDRSLDKLGVSESSLTFRSDGDIEFDGNQAGNYLLSAESEVVLSADYNNNGQGGLIRNGKTVDIDTSASGRIELQSAEDIRVSDWVESNELFRSLDLITTGNDVSGGNIIIDQSMGLSGTPLSLSFTSSQNIEFDDSHIGDYALKASALSLVAGNKGALNKNGKTVDIDVGADGQIVLQSAEDIRLSDWLGTSEPFRSLLVTTTGTPGSEGNIFIDQSFDLSGVSDTYLWFRSDGDINFDTSHLGGYSLGASDGVQLLADLNQDGHGALIRNGKTVNVDTISSGEITLQSAGDIRLSDWIETGAEFKSLAVTTTGTAGSEGNIIIDQSFDKSGVADSSLIFNSGGDIEFDNAHIGNYLLKADYQVFLLSDYNNNGKGALIKNGKTIDIGVDQYGQLSLQSASDIRLSDWLEVNESFGYLWVDTHHGESSEGDIIIDRSVQTGHTLSFQSAGDIEFDSNHVGNFSLVASVALSLSADANGDGYGGLIQNGKTINVGVSSGGSLSFRSAGHIRLSDWLSPSQQFEYLHVQTTGNEVSEGNITIDQSFIGGIGGYASISYRSAGDIEFDATNLSDYFIRPKYELSLIADSNRDGHGLLIRNGKTIDCNLEVFGSLSIQSAGDIRLSDWLDTSDNYSALSIVTTGDEVSEGNIIVDQSFSLSSSPNHYVNLGINLSSYGDIEFTKDLSLNSQVGANIKLNADYNMNGHGELNNAGNYDLVFDASSSGDINLMSGKDLRISDWLQNSIAGGNDTFNHYNASAGRNLYVDVDNIGGDHVLLTADHDHDGIGSVNLQSRVITRRVLAINGIDRADVALKTIQQWNPVVWVNDPNASEKIKVLERDKLEGAKSESGKLKNIRRAFGINDIASIRHLLKDLFDGREMRQIDLKTGVNEFNVDPTTMGFDRGMDQFREAVFGAQAASIEQRVTLDQTLKTGTTIQNVTGNVRVIASDGKIYDAQEGAELQEGDQVVTDNGSKVELSKGEDKVTVSEGSAVQVQKQNEEVGQPVQDLLTLAFGKVSVAVSASDGKSNFVLQAPSGMSGNRG